MLIKLTQWNTKKVGAQLYLELIAVIPSQGVASMTHTIPTGYFAILSNLTHTQIVDRRLLDFKLYCRMFDWDMKVT